MSQVGSSAQASRSGFLLFEPTLSVTDKKKKLQIAGQVRETIPKNGEKYPRPRPSLDSQGMFVWTPPVREKSHSSNEASLTR